MSTDEHEVTRAAAYPKHRRESPYVHDAILIFAVGFTFMLGYLVLWGLSALIGVFQRHGWVAAEFITGAVALGWCGAMIVACVRFLWINWRHWRRDGVK